jgi:uncharacterized membrane protein HdeD (DUF308 family)
VEIEADVEQSRRWWIFLVTGTLWFLVSLVVLRFNERSITTVGVIMGVVFVLGMSNELLRSVLDPSGWRWWHGFMAVLFGLGAIWAFAQPKEAFWALASVLGFILIFKGTLDVIVSTASRPTNGLWGLGLVVGLFELGLGFWASQQLAPARANFVLLWVGLAALFHGIGEIVEAFHLRRMRAEVALA